MAQTNRSESQHRSGSRSRKGHINVKLTHLVQAMNATEEGRADLRSLRNLLFPKVDPLSNAKFQALWKILKENNENFILNDASKQPEALNGNEIVWVRTVLGLCKTHCRKGKDGRNRACDGDCGALHVCRTFLLRSQNDCPFSSKKRKCMFGHSFATEHNVALLKAHNLFGLREAELQKLFRRRPSRCASTLPQVCIYYNKADGKQCKQKNCKSLHICSDFIQEQCTGACSRNHKLTTPQVQQVLELFAIGRSWTPELLLKDLQHFMTARHRAAGENNSSSDDSASYGSDIDEDVAERSKQGVPSFLQHEGTISYNQPTKDSCKGCEELKRDMKKMQQTISWLTSQVKELTKVTEELKPTNMSRPRSESSNHLIDDVSEAEMDHLTSRMGAMNGKDRKQAKDTISVIPFLVPTQGDTRFTRSQPDSILAGLQPSSTCHSGSEPDWYICDSSDEL